MRMLLIAALLLSSAAQAIPIRWELQDTSFEGGGGVSGFLVYDADAGDFWPAAGYHAGMYSDYAIHADAGALSAFDYTPAN